MINAGDVLGKLTAVRVDHQDHGAVWICTCACGRNVLRRGANLAYVIRNGGEPMCTACRSRSSHASRRVNRQERINCRLRAQWEETHSLYSYEDYESLSTGVANDLESAFGPTRAGDIVIDDYRIAEVRPCAGA